MKELVSLDELKRLMPHLNDGRARRYAPLLSAAMEEFDISSQRRRCAFLAQLAHESVELRYMEEIASGAAYEGRRDLGNTQPGDGKRYKGRGPIQLTGRTNYRRFGKVLGLDLEGQPELAAIPEHGFRIAALFWKLGGLNDLADGLTLKGGPPDYKIVRQITRRINGGVNGLAERWSYYKTAIRVLHNDDEDQPSPQAPVAPPAVRLVDAEQEHDSAEGQAENAAIVSTEEAGPDLLGTVVESPKARAVGGKFFAKHGGALLTWLGALYELHKWGVVVVALLIVAALLWVAYHNRQKLAPYIVKWLK